jgi:hypothetical protein
MSVQMSVAWCICRPGQLLVGEGSCSGRQATASTHITALQCQLPGRRHDERLRATTEWSYIGCGSGRASGSALGWSVDMG